MEVNGGLVLKFPWWNSKNCWKNAKNVIYKKKGLEEKWLSKKRSKEMHIEENNILNIDQTILSILLIDQTTKKNIMWATDNYKKNGIGY